MKSEGIGQKFSFQTYRADSLPAERRRAAEAPPEMAAPHDNVSLTAGRHEAAKPSAPAADAPAAEAASAKTAARSSVPVSLLADDFSFGVGAPGAVNGSHPTAGLGVLAQLDQASAVRSVRPVDDLSQPGPFGDMHLVGPSSAAHFLAHPEAMYLGA